MWKGDGKNITNCKHFQCKQYKRRSEEKKNTDSINGSNDEYRWIMWMVNTTWSLFLCVYGLFDKMMQNVKN